MTRFSAQTLDLSRFPPPLAIRGINFETIRSDGLLLLGRYLTDVGIPWDVSRLEANPAAIINRALSYRELNVYVAINDSVRAVMVAFAVGPDLEHLGAFYGVARRTIVAAANGQPAVLENDDELRRRVLLAPEAFAAAGPVGAYIFHALNADVRVLNVDVWSPKAGHVTVALQSRQGDGTASESIIETVRDHLRRPDIKPLTDVVSVRSVINIPYRVSGTGFVLPGPDRIAVKSQAIAAIEAMAAARRTPARDMPRSAVIAAASIAAMDKVVLAQPTTDIARGYGEVAVLSEIDFNVETYGG